MKRLVGLLIVVMVLSVGLGGYFLVELYRPFEPKVTAPKNLVPQYTGPGAVSQEPAVLDTPQLVE